MDEFRNRDSRLYVSPSKEAALDFVRNERRIELAAEDNVMMIYVVMELHIATR